MTAIQGCLVRLVERGGHALLLMLVALAAVVQGQARGAVRTVDHVDLDRYAGEWFEIARLANRFQKKCAGDVRAIYERVGGNRIAVINRCRTVEGQITEARGTARVVDTRTSAALKVRFAPAALSFLPFVWGDYWIVGLAEDYSWAVVGSPDRNYLWILARTTQLPERSYAAALDVARRNGFDLARLRRSEHSAVVRSSRRPARI